MVVVLVVVVVVVVVVVLVLVTKIHVGNLVGPMMASKTLYFEFVF